MSLPHSEILPVNHLSGVFNKTTNSYKFYWLLAILECVRERSEPIIPMSELLAKMVANVWYPVNYFKLSFGQVDRLGGIAVHVKSETRLSLDAEQVQITDEINRILTKPESPGLAKKLHSLMRFVPYRFLRPWFASELSGLPDHKVNSRIIRLATQSFRDTQKPSLYRFINEEEKAIEIPKPWFDYLTVHNKILKDFCLWNLLNYLQKNNPNVPNISEKLFAPQARNLNTARTFWRIVLEDFPDASCIYSGAPIATTSYSLDHFIPWKFVTHDLFWNLVPVPKAVNSAKSDSLPSLKAYFDKFAHIQRKAFRIMFQKDKIKLLEDYSNLYKCELRDIYDMPEQNFKDQLYSNIAPLIQIAKNMGFEPCWRFK